MISAAANLTGHLSGKQLRWPFLFPHVRSALDALAVCVSAAVNAVRASSALDKAESTQPGSRPTSLAAASADSTSTPAQRDHGGESIETQLLRMLTSPP